MKMVFLLKNSCLEKLLSNLWLNNPDNLLKISCHVTVHKACNMSETKETFLVLF